MIPPSTPPGVAADDRAELRREAEHDGHQRRDVVRGGGVDAGRGHDADVLGVRGGRRAADERGDRGADAVGEQRPAHVRVEVVAGHLGDRLDVAGVLGDQRDDAGQHEQDEGEGERGQVRPGQHAPARLDDVLGREPNQDAADTPLQSTRSCRVGVQPAPPQEVIWPNILSNSQDSTVPKIRPRSTAIRDQKPAHDDRHDDHEAHGEQGHPLVLRPVDAGHHRRQVEPDQHDDSAGHRRRQHQVHPARAGVVDRDADQGQHDAGHQDRAGDVGAVAALRPDRGHRGHERGAGAQVGGHLAVDDEQEQDRGDAGHHHGELRVEAHQDREDEGGAEHGHHVLRTQSGRAAPGQPFPRLDDLPGWRGLPVVRELPTERHADSFALDQSPPGRARADRDSPRDRSR